jgi:predicted nucleic acid-binding protein
VSEPILVDTSIAVPYIIADHEHHEAVSAYLAGSDLGLAGHAAFETYSVLTRLPPPLRRSPTTVGRLLASNFPRSAFLSADRAAALLRDLPALAVSGGTVYDALVGAAAAEAKLRLISADRRAAETYRLLNVDVRILA